ncbi:hypothetical protein PUR59_01535 [Streptomyces sp. SP18ES09]|uniref:hypothetical protein n=1 Tax=Streptomyces sp. SP18ES09 TaxID=3002532 RepID=UPI002E7839D2|nr:hypothetical protein [Streptomyces sp. SP18ES09]MEE1813723.1 hypothetical protein [Streptomyces sp. SP18ES09]
MAITVPLFALFGLILAFLLRAKTLSLGSAFIAAAFGFFLASTGAAKPINQLTENLIQALSNL